MATSLFGEGNYNTKIVAGHKLRV